MPVDSFDPAAGVPDNVPFLLTEFRTTPGTPDNDYQATYYFEVHNAVKEEIGKRSGDLVPHLAIYLTSAEINGLKRIMDKLLTAAQAAVDR